MTTDRDGSAVLSTGEARPAWVEGSEGRPSRAAASSTGASSAASHVLALASKATRRLLDIAVAGVVLLVFSPVICVVAVAIRMESGGPVIFRQRRVGRGQRPFTMLKFRSMRHEADVTPHREYVESLISRPAVAEPEDPEHGRLYKLSVDDRITRVGRVLRSWSLDELPQLVNVLRGEMALVGPRPVVPYEVERYPHDYLQRFEVKPGLTGLWQVSGRNERTYDEMVRFDIEYAERSSLRFDLRILLKTVPVVLGRRGVA